jgi:hypothetical protein
MSKVTTTVAGPGVGVGWLAALEQPARMKAPRIEQRRRYVVIFMKYPF